MFTCIDRCRYSRKRENFAKFLTKFRDGPAGCPDPKRPRLPLQPAPVPPRRRPPPAQPAVRADTDASATSLPIQLNASFDPFPKREEHLIINLGTNKNKSSREHYGSSANFGNVLERLCKMHFLPLGARRTARIARRRAESARAPPAVDLTQGERMGRGR